MLTRSFTQATRFSAKQRVSFSTLTTSYSKSTLPLFSQTTTVRSFHNTSARLCASSKVSTDPIEEMLANNKVWAEEMISSGRGGENMKVHAPKALWIGCSDARVPANQIIGQEAGNLFVHRNVANLVVNTDVNLMSVLQYAVDYLKVKDIIVCGHYDCGGVRAAMSANDHQAPLENWIRNIRDVIRLHKAELFAIEDEEARYRRLIELNTAEQVLNIYKTGVVQGAHAAAEEALPRVHGMVYDPISCEIQRVPVDYRAAVEEDSHIQRIFKLH